MKWPPSKCWTSPYSKNGNRHYFLKRYWGSKNNRFVELSAAKDCNFIIKISWNELKSKWHSTWLVLPSE